MALFVEIECDLWWWDESVKATPLMCCNVSAGEFVGLCQGFIEHKLGNLRTLWCALFVKVVHFYVGTDIGGSRYALSLIFLTALRRRS